MAQPVHYTSCPVCRSTMIRELFAAKDHTVTGLSFKIMECANCTLRFTQDAPGTEEIASYYQSEDYISHTNTAKGLVNRLYQVARKRTLVTKRKLIERVAGMKGGRLLDVGSGTGAFINEMKLKGWNADGLEPDSGARDLADKLYGVGLQDMNVFYQLDAGSYDVITLWHVLEHVHDLHPYLQQLKQLLRENGRLFIAVPNYTSMDAKWYGKNWAAYDVPRHLYHFSPRAMEVLLEKNGLHLLGCQPMWFDSFYISLLSSRYKNGKTNIAAAFMNGLRSNLAAWRNSSRCSSVIYLVGK